MAELLTPEGVDLELALTSDYDVAGDLDKATRRVAALRRKLDFPQTMARLGEEQMTLAVQIIDNQLRQALAWIAANGAADEADRLKNPDVLHADFGTLRGYR